MSDDTVTSALPEINDNHVKGHIDLTHATMMLARGIDGKNQASLSENARKISYVQDIISKLKAIEPKIKSLKEEAAKDKSETVDITKKNGLCDEVKEFQKLAIEAQKYLRLDGRNEKISPHLLLIGESTGDYDYESIDGQKISFEAFEKFHESLASLQDSCKTNLDITMIDLQLETQSYQMIWRTLSEIANDDSRSKNRMINQTIKA